MAIIHEHLWHVFKILQVPTSSNCGTIHEDESPFRKNRGHLIKTKGVCAWKSGFNLLCVIYLPLLHAFVFIIMLVLTWPL